MGKVGSGSNRARSASKCPHLLALRARFDPLPKGCHRPIAQAPRSLGVFHMREQNGLNDLRAIAHQAMTDRGLDPDFPPDAIRQLNGITGPARETDPAIRDLRSLLWCS